ncbi:LGFP repeat-containing protein [Spirosoma pulveris]
MIQAYLSSIHCHEETDEAGADEPYLLVTTVNLASSVSVAGFPVPIPAYEVFLYGPFGDVDKGETHPGPGIAQPFWGLDRAPAPLADPEQVLFVVALMENDDGSPGNLRGIVKGIVAGSVLSSLSLSRVDKVAALIRDVNSAIATPTGAPNFDDTVGMPQELRFSGDELRQAESGLVVSKSLVFAGDGGRYTLNFEAVNEFGLYGAIREKWVQSGRVTGPLGRPVSGEIATFDTLGRFQNFTGGIISWHPTTGAHIVWGAIGERWLQVGREAFGYPITDEVATSSGHGRFNHFQAIQLPGKPVASIYWSPESGAHEIYGAIRDKWIQLGSERSRLGYPISAETDQAGGRLQRFQGGSLFWTPRSGVVVQ